MITFTDTGAQKVKEFLASQNADVSTSGLRVGVRGGGCSGFQYALAFDTQRDGDEVCRAPASRSTTPTWSPRAAAAPPSGSRKRKRYPRSETAFRGRRPGGRAVRLR